MTPKIAAPMHRKSNVKVIEVVMSWADLPNCFSRFVTLSETLKKSMESQVHAKYLEKKIRLSGRRSARR